MPAPSSAPIGDHRSGPDPWSPSWVEAAVPRQLPDATIAGPTLAATADAVLIEVPTVARYLTRRQGPVEVQRADGATDDDVTCFLDGPVAAARWLLDGHFTIYGGAAAVDGRGVVICGPPAAGTSTILAALALRGHAVLADRLVSIAVPPPGRGASRTSTGVPDDPTDDRADDDRSDVRGRRDEPTILVRDVRLQLWPTAIAALGLDPADGTVVRPALAKRRLTLGPAGEATPLGAVVVIHPQRTSAISHERVRGADVVARLLGREWHARLVTPLGLDADRFAWTTAIGRHAPLIHLVNPEGRARAEPRVLAEAIEAAADP